MPEPSEGGSLRFAGRAVGPAELTLIREVVGSCPGLSRMELAHTVCELLGWTRPQGTLKGREARAFLEGLAARGLLALPAKRPGRPVGARTAVPVTARGDPGAPLTGTVGEVGPIGLEEVREPAQRALFRELVGRYHYRGYAVPFGASLRYLVSATHPARQVVGCLQFSSPAWRLAVRDRWIGWDEATRRRNLQRVVSNSRFLLLPWVRVQNLASTVLARAVRRLAADWAARYAVTPLLVETLVEPGRAGTCYRAANWRALGATAGRGRQDRAHARHGAAPKTVLVYPLVADAVQRLREG
jgi:hypothetical protein